MADWHDRFYRYFEVQSANTPDLLREAMSLRYQVYCVERAYADHKLYQDGLEKDEFDHISVQSVLRHLESREVAATVRLIRPSAEIESGLLPMELHCQIDPEFRSKISDIPREQIGEISRLAVSKQFRRRLGEEKTTQGAIESSTLHQQHLDDRRSIMPLITLGLFQAIVTMSSEQDITFWIAVMEPQLLRLLRGFGVAFVQVGPTTNYHGKRIPCVGRISQVLAGVRLSRPDVWEFLTQNGTNTGGVPCGFELEGRPDFCSEIAAIKPSNLPERIF